MKAVLFLVSLFVGATVAAANPSEDIQTIGTAQLPASLTLANGGEVTTYTFGLNRNAFTMYDDASFSMGATTMCDPYIGQTVKDVKIPLFVSTRLKYNPTATLPGDLEVPHTSHALLTLPKGTRVYGVCQSETTILTAVTFQNDRAFALRWSSK